ncbi:hypothetical protein BD289DRAFT_200887 [Coniella lustricola]|uniref:Uncharacterized protein n=1 Tax=Coniella lustricola TaxID=2025994 RepID=A0A2T3ACE7_9PEZI|nr:hypothetical protein BD289DRAFT_200887 [Coniella lustricola]
MAPQARSPSARFYAERGTSSPAVIEQVSHSRDTVHHGEVLPADLFSAFRGFGPSNTAHDPVYYPNGHRRNSGSLISPRMPALLHTPYDFHQHPAHTHSCTNSPRQRISNGGGLGADSGAAAAASVAATSTGATTVRHIRSPPATRERFMRTERPICVVQQSLDPVSIPPSQAAAAIGNRKFLPLPTTKRSASSSRRFVPLPADMENTSHYYNNYNSNNAKDNSVSSPTSTHLLLSSLGGHGAAFGTNIPPDDLVEYNAPGPSVIYPSESASNLGLGHGHGHGHGIRLRLSRSVAVRHVRQSGLGGVGGLPQQHVSSDYIGIERIGSNHNTNEKNLNDNTSNENANNNLHHSILGENDVLDVHDICLTVTQWYLERLRVNWHVRNGEKVSSYWQDVSEGSSIVEGIEDDDSGGGRRKRRAGDGCRGRHTRRCRCRYKSRYAGIEKPGRSTVRHRSSSFDERSAGARCSLQSVDNSCSKQNNVNSHNDNNKPIDDDNDDDDAYYADSDEEREIPALRTDRRCSMVSKARQRHRNGDIPYRRDRCYHHCRHPRQHQQENKNKHERKEHGKAAPIPRGKQHRRLRRQNPIPAPTTSLLDNIRHICGLIWRRAQRDRQDVLDAEARACREMSVLLDCGVVIVTFVCARKAAQPGTTEEGVLLFDGEVTRVKEKNGRGIVEQEGRQQQYQQQNDQNGQYSKEEGWFERVMEAGKAICRVLGDQDGLERLEQMEQVGHGAAEDGYVDAWD